eukprot:g9146.t1
MAGGWGGSGQHPHHGAHLRAPELPRDQTQPFLAPGPGLVVGNNPGGLAGRVLGGVLETRPRNSDQAENYLLRQETEKAAFYVGGLGHLAEVVASSGVGPGTGRYSVARTWALPNGGARIVKWMTRFKSVEGERRVAVLVADKDGKGRHMLVVDLVSQGGGGQLQVEKTVDLDPSSGQLSYPVGASASKSSDRKKLYVSMFLGGSGVATVENYSVKTKNAQVRQFRLADLLDETEKKLHHVHNVHTFPADMCGGAQTGAADVVLAPETGEFWNDYTPGWEQKTRGYGMLQLVETADGGGYFRKATQLSGVAAMTSPLMAGQMHARQAARDPTAPETLFVAEQPVKAGGRDTKSRLHWLEVKRAGEGPGICALTVRATAELPARASGAAGQKLRSHVLITDRSADDKDSAVYLYEGNGSSLAKVGPGWRVGKHPRHTALLADGKTLLSAHAKGRSVSVHDISVIPSGSAAQPPAEELGLAFDPWFVLE